MQRGILKCGATTCVHNRSYECKAGTIHVSGRGAEEVEGTSCTTFAERQQQYYKQFSWIRCEAHNCKYNENKECYAENVQIDQVNAYCNSFEYGENRQFKYYLAHVIINCIFIKKIAQNY